MIPRGFVPPTSHAVSAARTTAAARPLAEPIKPHVVKLATSLALSLGLKHKAPNAKGLLTLPVTEPISKAEVGALLTLFAPEAVKKGYFIRYLAVPVGTPGQKGFSTGSLDLHRDPRFDPVAHRGFSAEKIAATLLAQDMLGRPVQLKGRDAHFSGSRNAYALGLDEAKVFEALRDELPGTLVAGRVYVKFNKGPGAVAIEKPTVHVIYEASPRAASQGTILR